MYKKLVLLVMVPSVVMAASSIPGMPSPEIKVGLSPEFSSDLAQALLQSGDAFNNNTDKFLQQLGTSLPKVNPGLVELGQGLGDAARPLTSVMLQSTVLGAAYVGIIHLTSSITNHIVRKYVARYLFEPRLIEARSPRGLGNFLYRKSAPVTIQDHMVICDALIADLTYVMNMTKTVKKNGGQFENVLLYGAPGTGKTLFAQLLAEHCGMDYAIVPAANVSQFLTKGTVVEELNNLFEWAAASKHGTIIFFDESETFLADRSTLDITAQNALSAFLAKTGTPSDKIMIICTTNRPEVIDKAVLSRLGLQIQFPLPDDAARQAQLQMHIKKVFGNQKGTQVTYAYLADPAVIADISVQLEGCSGRTLQKFVSRLRQSALAQDQLEINADVVRHVIEQIKKDLTK